VSRRARVGLSVVAILGVAAAVALWRAGAWREGGAVPPPRATPTAPGSLRGEAGLDVLLVTVDTLRADALGAYGSPRAATPWMDRLAAGGVRFARARAHNVVTLPSHATILSGLYPQQHGVRDNSGFRFPEGIDTLATLLAARGYRTGAFVSAFTLDSRFGLDRGFDVYDDGFVGAGARPALVEQERRGVDTVARAARWLAAADGAPSFAWVHLYEPHFPYAPPPPFDRRFAGDPYLGDVAAADAALEPLLAPILGAGPGGHTLVVLTADHGEALGEHGEATHGIFAYEGTLRVPLVVYQPRLLAPRTVASPARLIDVLPTILDLVAAPAPPGLPGRSLVDSAVDSRDGAAGEGGGGPGVASYFEALSGQLDRGWAPLFGVVRDGWKYIRLPIPELYDLGSDPGEARNQASSEPRRVAELEAVLETLRGADRGPAPAAEDAETAERLRSLGYLGGGEAAKASYDESDDPKRLIALDATLREVAGLYAAGDLAGARSRCRDLVRRRPGMRIALMTLAQIEHDLGDVDAAVESLRRALDLRPAEATTLALLVSYLTQAGRPEEAVEVSAAHARGARPDIDVLFMRSLALARLGRSEEALAAIAKAAEIDPGNPMVPVFQGTQYLMGGRRREARAEFERALRLDAGTVAAHTSLAVLDSEEGRFDEALEHWRRAVELEPREHAKLLAFAGRLWGAGRRAEARPLLELFAVSAPPDRFAADLERVREILAGSP
jgi:choline-sulfatase